MLLKLSENSPGLWILCFKVCVCARARTCPGESLRSILAPRGTVDQELAQGRSWALMTGQVSQMTRELLHAHDSGLPALPGGICAYTVASSWTVDVCELSSVFLPGREPEDGWEQVVWVPFLPGVCFMNVYRRLGSVCGTPQSYCHHPRLFLSGIQATRGGRSPFS